MDLSRRNLLVGGACLSVGCQAALTPAVDQTRDLQARIDATAQAGGIVTLPPGVIRLSDTLMLRSGVSLQGSGRHYEYEDGNRFTGTWLRYEGPPNKPALQMRSIQNCAVRSIGIDCREIPDTTAIEIGSDNHPAAKSLILEELSIFGAGLGVRWGLGNRLASLEQCDDVSVRDISLHSCGDGFLIDAMNAADYSRISRVTFSQLRGTAFNLRGAGFMAIDNCAAGTLADTAIMFDVSGSSPDPLRITGCQMEPRGRFLVATGPNDQRQIVLEANVVNNPIDVSGTVRVDSRDNYFNDQLKLSGFVRWRSRDDVWDGMRGRPAHQPQVIQAESVQFVASGLLNAEHYFGAYLPRGFRLEYGDDAVIGEIVVREGVLCPAFVPGPYAVGAYVRPRQDNGRAYRVVRGGTAAAEPDQWGTRAAAGTVEFEAVGSSAVMRRYGLLVPATQ